jgi:hypothetical protein
MRAGRAAACVLWLAACACTDNGRAAAPSVAATSAPAPSGSSLDLAVCESDQRFLSAVDRNYTDATNFFNRKVAHATPRQTRRALIPYLRTLRRYAEELRTGSTSAPFDPVRLAFLHGIQHMAAGLRIEYFGGVPDPVTFGSGLVDRGYAELTAAYRELFAVSRRSCPGSPLAKMSPPG